MKFQKFSMVFIILLLMFLINCKGKSESPVQVPAVKEIPPWEKIVTEKEAVKDAPESSIDGYFLILTDSPKFYTEPGGKLITKANIKTALQECAGYDFFPQKNETGLVFASAINNYTKYYKITTFSLPEVCEFQVWVQGSEGAFLSYSQFNEFTKTKSSLDPQLTAAIASSKIEPLNFISAKKTLMISKPAGQSFYLINIMGTIFPPRLREKGYNFYNHQFVVIEKDGVYTLVSPDLKVNTLDPDKKTTEKPGEDMDPVPSIKYADVDADGIPEIITFLPAVGGSPRSELYGFVDGQYRMIGDCPEGNNCFYEFDKKNIVKNLSKFDVEKKDERYKYKTGKLSLIPDTEQK